MIENKTDQTPYIKAKSSHSFSKIMCYNNQEQHVLYIVQWEASGLQNIFFTMIIDHIYFHMRKHNHYFCLCIVQISGNHLQNMIYHNKHIVNVYPLLHLSSLGVIFVDFHPMTNLI